MIWELLKDFPVIIATPVAWGEMDAFQHVNNIVYFRYFESCRIAYFERIDFMEFMEQQGIGPILAHTACRYRAPLTYPDTVSVGAKVTEMKDDRFTMALRVVSHKLQKVAADGTAELVSYDYRNLQKAPMPEEIRSRIEELEGRQFS